MEMRQANKSMQKSGIKMQTGLHYDISQVTNEHFEAESQAVGFPDVSAKWEFSCHLSTFGSDSFFFLFCSYVLCTLSCVYACTRVHLHSHKCTPVFLAYPGYSKPRKEHFSHKVAADCALAVQSFPSLSYQGALYLRCWNHKTSLPLELTGEQSSQSI